MIISEAEYSFTGNSVTFPIISYRIRPKLKCFKISNYGSDVMNAHDF